MGLPSINITFQTKGASAIERGTKGALAMILLDVVGVAGNYVLESIADIPAGLSVDNKEQISLAFLGGVATPSKILLSVVTKAGTGDTDITAALGYIETVKFDYFVFPEISDAQVVSTMAWIKGLRTNKRTVKAVLPNAGGDSEAVINFASNGIKVGAKTYTAKQYCSRIAGMAAGNPLTQSLTFQVLPEVTDVVPHLSKADLDAAIDAGKLVIFHDGEKVKIARGINSLVTTSDVHGDAFKKIKIVDTLDMISNDISETVNDNYIGKVTNNYDNKCVLISAINGYFDVLVNQNIIDKGSISEIDVESQIAYLKTAGKYIVGMNTQAVKEANTADKVFLKANVAPLDAMENIALNIAL
jgi:hypothetical protein